MKKILAVLLACSMLFAFAACGGNNEETTTTAAPETTVAEETTEAETEPEKPDYQVYADVLQEKGSGSFELIYVDEDNVVSYLATLQDSKQKEDPYAYLDEDEVIPLIILS